MKHYQSINTTTDDDEEVISPKPKLYDNGIVVDVGGSNDGNPHPDDHLAPPFDSNERPSNLFVGTFNLVATTVGGGVLSLPLVFHRCGLAFTTLAMIFSAYLTYASLIMLCHSGRRGGGSSYGEVARSAFGERAEEGVSWLLFVFLMFVIAGYMVLIRDIWTPLASQVLGLDDVDGDHVLLTIVVLLLPFLFQRSLHALRYNCYVGSASIFVLCVALCRGGLQRLASIEDEKEDDNNDSVIDIFKMPSPQDILFSFPIVTCSFLCHFNIIPIQNALIKPTRQRIQNLTGYAIGISFLLMYTFGLGGYLYAGSNTEGNILLNVPMAREAGEDEEEYLLFLLGRIGCGITIMFAMPMMVLPCREALLEVVDVHFHHSHHLENEQSGSAASREEEGRCWKVLHRFNSNESVQDAHITTEDEVMELLPDESDDGGRTSVVLIRRDPIQSDYVFRNTLAHYGSTLLIITACYLGAVAVCGVAVIWSFIGSSMAFFIAFILPSASFIVIESPVPKAAEGGDRRECWIRFAWAILLFSIVGAVVCTVNSTAGLAH